MKKTLFLIVLSSAMAIAESQTNVTAILYGNCDLHGKEGGYTVSLYEGEYSKEATPDKIAPAVGAESSSHHQYHYTLSLWGGDVNNLTVIINGDAPSAEVLDTSNTVNFDTENSTQICNDVYAGAGNRNTGSNENAWVVNGNAHIIMEGGFVDGALSGAGRIGETKGNVTIDMNGGYAKYGIRGAGGNSPTGNVGGNVGGNVTINMSGGFIGKKTGVFAEIVGGGYGPGSDYGYGKNGSVSGNTSINITGGKLYRTSITGGGYCSSVGGNASVLFDATEKEIDAQKIEVLVHGYEWAPGANEDNEHDGTIGGDSSITFIGDKLTFSGYLLGDRNERVTGKDSLQFGNDVDAFKGELGVRIEGFQEVNICAGSNVAIKDGIADFAGYHELCLDEEDVPDSDVFRAYGMYMVKQLNMGADSVLELGDDVIMYDVQRSAVSGTIMGGGLIEDSVISGSVNSRNRKAPTVYVGKSDGSTCNMTWNSLTLQNASVALLVNSLQDYSTITLKFDPYYVNGAAGNAVGNAITLSNTSLLLDFSAQFNQSELKPGVSFTLFNIEQGVAFGGENGEFSVSELPELPKGMAWDVSRLYTEGLLMIVGMEAVSPEDVQAAIAANWGVFKSAQAFTGTLWSGRGVVSCVNLDSKGATDKRNLAWGTAYGHGSRIGGNGADYSIYGAAIGLERALPKNRSLGIAFGYDCGKVSPFNSAEVDQQSAHLALYGRAWSHCLKNRDGVAVDWVAAYGQTDSEYDALNGKVSQNSLLLEGRVGYFRQVSERTSVRAFGSMQYFAMDSDSIGDVRVGTLQNLRMQLGTGISYKATNRTSVFGEAALHYDAMRHNPYVEANGERLRNGANPGRFGGNIAVGVDYQLNNDWSLRGSYSFEAASDNSEHNVNVGAVYSF